MGGFGSGQYGDLGDSSDTTEDYRSLDIRQWRRDGLLTADRLFGWNWTRNGLFVGRGHLAIFSQATVSRRRSSLMRKGETTSTFQGLTGFGFLGLGGNGAGSLVNSSTGIGCKNSFARSGFASSHSSRNSSGMITSERFSSPGLWN